MVIGCDGIHSVVRRQFFPEEGPPIYSGVNMWRGTTVWESFLSGSTCLRAGWLTVGKMVIYPIRHNVDSEGRQLVNWVAAVATERFSEQDWNRAGHSRCPRPGRLPAFDPERGRGLGRL